jgi:hypothetical protein
VLVSENGNDKPWESKVAVLTANNGTNCVNSPCMFRKSGADQLPNDLKPDTTLYVSVVSRAGRSCTQPGDQWEIDKRTRGQGPRPPRGLRPLRSRWSLPRGAAAIRN